MQLSLAQCWRKGAAITTHLNRSGEAPQGQHEVSMINHPIRALILILATAFAVSVASTANAQGRARYDGSWSVLVITRSGACDQSYRYGVYIQNGIVSYAGGAPGALSGRVSSNGSVSVTVS